jgi:Rho-binding antiterminator
MISCQQYDYIEIACMYQFDVIITLMSGETITATALDTKRNAANLECIAIKQSGDITLVELNQILSLEALKANPHFDKITFNH